MILDYFQELFPNVRNYYKTGLKDGDFKWKDWN